MKNLRNGVIRDNVDFKGYSKVFKVFGGYPFYEEWTDREVEEEYQTSKNGGHIFGYYTEDGECVSILVMKPYEPSKHPVNYPKDAKVMYLSDIATSAEYRRHGIGTHLLKYAIRHMRVLGYDYIYLRTNEENSMSYGIAKKCGFKEIPGCVQEVERRRTDGTVAKDKRIFMEKKLSK